MPVAEPLGEYGGRVLRRIQSGGAFLEPGHRLTAAECLAWPQRNRVALRNTGKVLFFNAPPTPETVVAAAPPADIAPMPVAAALAARQQRSRRETLTLRKGG